MTGPIWLGRNSPTSMLLTLPRELLLKIITNVATESTDNIYPTSLIELSQCCRQLYYIIHNDPTRLRSLWPRAFRCRFDTGAIYRRRLNHRFNWQAVLKRRCTALNKCLAFAAEPTQVERLDSIDWEAIWDMITEHDQYNIPHLLNYQVQFAAGVAFQLGRFRDREVYPVVLPILSLLVNYDFTIARFFTGEPSTAIVSSELSQFAYNFEADTLITQHTPLRYFHSWNSTELPLSSHKFYPAQDPLASAFHLFFATIFASNPNIYQSIPGCIPIPLFPLSSEQFDVEFLRRYERRLFFSSLNTKDINYTIPEYEEHFGPENIYADSGFASSSHYVSEARLIEGEWMGYYTFQDLEDSEATNTTPTIEDWFDGPMRLTLKIVPLEDAVQNGGEQQPLPPSWISRWEDDEKNSTNSNEPRKRRKLTNTSSEPFPASHLRSCPLTRFEGTGVDNLGTFSITGLVDDTEEGQVTWEKHYVDSGERWEYSGRFAWPMGLCGRWGDEEYGGPWWMWKISNNETALPTISTITK